MDHVGNIVVKGGGQLRSIRIDNVVADPVSPFVGQIWTNTVENAFKGFNGTEVLTFASGGNTALLQTEIDAIEAAIGLNADGTFALPALTNYLSSATNVVQLSALLDAQIKLTNDAIIALQGSLATTDGVVTSVQAELDTVETSVGLTATGALPVTTGNYFAAPTSVVNIATQIDSGVKAQFDVVGGLIASANENVSAEQLRALNQESAIRAEFAAADSTITTAANKEVADRTAEDVAIRAEIAALGTGNSSALAQEIADRTAADTLIRTDFAAADTALEGTVTQEAADRAAADTAIRAEFAAADVVVAGTVTQEIADRTAADSLIRTDFAAADAVVTALVNQEATDREAADAFKVSKSGDSMSGSLAFGDVGTVTGLLEPVNASDAATKNYVDNVATNLSWKLPVTERRADVASQYAGEMPLNYRAIDTTDGKIYYPAGAEWATYQPVDGDAVFDKSDETGYVYSGTEWVQFTGGGQMAAGVGLSKTGNRFDINLGAGIAQLPTDEVGIDLYATGGLQLTLDGETASEDSSAQIGIKLANGSLTLGINGLSLSAANQTSIDNTVSGLATETYERQSADNALNTLITQAVSDQVAQDVAIRAEFAAADVALYQYVDAATSDRVTQEVAIRSEFAAADVVLTQGLNAEVALRESEDVAIRAEIAAIGSGSSAALTQEIADRTAADTLIRTDFAAADTTLQAAIDTANGGITTLNGQVDALQTADTTILGNISTLGTEVRAEFAAADTLIQTELDQVETSVGLAANGAFPGFTTTNYLNTSATVLGGMELLDAAVKSVSNSLEGSSFLYTGAVAQTDHIVQHALGKQFVQVVIVDSTNKKIQPDAVTFDNANQLTVSFISAITCKVYVTR